MSADLSNDPAGLFGCPVKNRCVVPKVIAHRGASGITGEDNTLRSFQTAWEMGCDMVEFDVRPTRDGALACFHDREVDGVAVDQLTLNELRTRSGNDVPLLADTVKSCRNNIRLDVEVKEPGFETEILEILKNGLGYEDYVVKSFLPEVVEAIAEIDGSVRRGLLLPDCKKGGEDDFICEFRRNIAQCRPDFLSPFYRLLKPWFLEQEDFRLPLLVWTVNEPEIMRTLLTVDADIAGIITDRPDYLLEVLNSSGKEL